MVRGFEVRNKLLALILIFSVMIGVTSCNFWGSIQNTIDYSAQNISSVELARIIVTSIKEKDSVADNYVSIPEHQRENVSYSDYYEFIDVLRNTVSGRGELVSFRILKQADRIEYIASVLSKSGNDTSVLTDYGNVEVVQLVFDDNNDKYPVRFFISTTSDGLPYLSNLYVRDTLAAYNYIEHYFTMIADENTSGIKTILEPSYTDDIYISSVVEAKVGMISEYYRSSVLSDVKEYVFSDLTPFYVNVVIPETLSDNGNDVVEHNVSVTKNTDGIFCINDVVPLERITQSISIFYHFNKTFAIGDEYSDEEIVKCFGEPIYLKVDSNEDEFYTHSITYMYNGLVLTYYVNENRNHEYEGVLHSARIFGQGYTIDNSIYVGMSVSELLLIYPMIDEYDYTYTFTINNNDYSLQFEFDENNNISAIRIY